MSQNDEIVDAVNANLQKVYERERASEIAALRDHFAGQALPVFAGQMVSMTAVEAMSVVRANRMPAGTSLSRAAAFLSYAYADAMLAARKGGKA